MRKDTRSLAVIWLSCMMILLLCSCGSSQSSGGSEKAIENSTENHPNVEKSVESTSPEKDSASSENTLKWKIQKEVDEFGDEIKDGANVLATQSTGDFSNTATASSDLLVDIHMVYFNNAPVFQFNLYEYGNVGATVSSFDPISMSIKANDEISDVKIETLDNSSSLYTAITDGKWNGYDIYNYLTENQDVRCIIHIGKSQYNFTIESSNFVSACEEAFPDRKIVKEDTTDNSTTSTSLSEAQIGDVINYGKTESGESISWIVLDQKDNDMLVISEFILLEQPFFSEYSSELNFANCSLREWLNNEFITNSFTEDESKNILETEHICHFGINYKEEAASSQKVFLLNREEAEKYFSDENSRISRTIDKKNIPHYWSLSDGWTIDKTSKICLSLVTDEGEISDYPVAACAPIAVRPAMWITLSN